jgi:hypothetical protein
MTVAGQSVAFAPTLTVTFSVPTATADAAMVAPELTTVDLAADTLAVPTMIATAEAVAPELLLEDVVATPQPVGEVFRPFGRYEFRNRFTTTVLSAPTMTAYAAMVPPQLVVEPIQDRPAAVLSTLGIASETLYDGSSEQDDLVAVFHLLSPV